MVLVAPACPANDWKQLYELALTHDTTLQAARFQHDALIEARPQAIAQWLPQKYRLWLDNYASEQKRLGRFHWPNHTNVRDVRDWLAYQHVVDDNVKILVLVSFSFLLVCLLNAMGLMLAKIMGRAADIGVRRALGADRGAIFTQCLIEAGVVGLAGGLLGLGLTSLGLLGLRSLLSESVGRLTHFSVGDVIIAVLLAVMATTVAGLYPTWRAAQVQPAWQLKAQ
jgi:putative ABC transport system permease protein